MGLRLLIVLLALGLLTGACGSDTSSETSTSGSDSASGGQEEHAADPKATAKEINSLLDDLVVAYEGGDAEAAGELAAVAYLDNYEHIEDPIEDAAEDVNEELETLLGAELRRAIREGAPLGEIKAMVSRVRALLDDALAALEPSQGSDY